MTPALQALGAGLLAFASPPATPATPDAAEAARRAPPPVAATLPTIEVRGIPRAGVSGPFPIASTVLGREEIARRPGGDLADLLPQAAGLRLVARGDPALGAAVSIRGSTSEQVLGLVDGRRLNSAQGGAVDLAALSLDSVERVEILRGGASAAWGPDAIGGAIHVVTKGAASRVPRVRVAGGTGGARDLSGEAGVRIAPAWSAHAGGRFATTRGDAPGADGADRVENADLRRASGDLAIEGTFAGGVRVRADAAMLRGERGVPGSEEFPTPSARLEDARDSFAVRFDRARDGGSGEAGASGGTRGVADGGRNPLALALDVAALVQERRYREPEAALGALDETHRHRRMEASLSGAWESPRGALHGAAGATLDGLVSTTDGRRERKGAFVRTQLARDFSRGSRRARLLAGARADALEGFAPRVSPRVGAEADVVPEVVRARASAGLAFRAPTFDDLFWPARASAAGNPDLRPETARDADLGFEIRTRDGRARLAAEGFVRRVDDLIQWAPGAGGVWRPHNVGRARLSGIETELALATDAADWGALSFAGTLNRLSTRDESGEPNVDGRELVYRPRWSGSASIVFARSRALEVESFTRIVGDAWVTRANTKPVAGYAITDLRVRTHPLPGVGVDLAITNLLDGAARDFRDYPLPGRGAEIGFTFQGVDR